MEKSIVFIIIISILVFGFLIYNEDNKPKVKDALAQRIESLKAATWDLPDDQRERLLMEVIKGATNVSPESVLEK